MKVVINDKIKSRRSQFVGDQKFEQPHGVHEIENADGTIQIVDSLEHMSKFSVDMFEINSLQAAGVPLDLCYVVESDRLAGASILDGALDSVSSKLSESVKNNVESSNN